MQMTKSTGDESIRAGLVQRYRARLTDERFGFDAWSRKPEMALGTIAYKQQMSAGHHESTLPLKPMGRVIQSPKRRVPVAPYNRPPSNKNFKNKEAIGLMA